MFLRQLFFKFARRYPVWLLATILLGFSGALFNGVSTALIIPVVLEILGQELDLTRVPPVLRTIMAPFEDISETYRLAAMAGAILLAIILKNLAGYASTLTASSLTRTLTADLREEGLRLLLEVDLNFFTQMKIGDLIHRLGGETGKTISSISSIIQLLIVSITITVFIWLLLSISWQMTIASTFLLGLVLLVNQNAISRSKYFGKQLAEMSKGYSIRVLELLNGIRLVKATGNEEREYKRLEKLIRDREKADFNSQVVAASIGPISEVTSILVLMTLLLLGRSLFANQVESLSAILLTYLFVLLRLLPFIGNLNNIRSKFANSAASVDLVSDFLRRDNKPFMKSGSVLYKKLQEGIHFNHISFSYPDHSALVLQDVDLYLPHGTTLALVGGSGAGKSTLADLLPRFYDPTDGTITLDSKDMREFEIKSLRKSMGIVSQDTFLFNDSVASNIAYSRPEATEDEIIMAAKRANAYEFIVKLPQGLDTLIGDRGVMLSGGQRQRLAIARALLQNPEILILDEATSALDTVSERLVQSALDDLSRDRTTLVIAHRLSTVQKADQIAVLEQGRVVEVGTHTELLQKGGYYSRLYMMQFAQKVSAPNTHNETFIRISHEVRTRLNTMIGFLRLLVDDMVDNLTERQELIWESYNSATRLFNMLEFFEDSVKSQANVYKMSPSEQNQSLLTRNETFIRVSQEFRTRLHPTINCLQLLADKRWDIPEEQNELLEEAYQSTVHLLDSLQLLEDSFKI